MAWVEPTLGVLSCRLRETAFQSLGVSAKENDLMSFWTIEGEIILAVLTAGLEERGLRLVSSCSSRLRFLLTFLVGEMSIRVEESITMKRSRGKV